MDIKQIINNDFKNVEQRAVERVLGTPDNVLQDSLRELQKSIDQAIIKAQRTIKPVRLILSIDAMLLLSTTPDMIKRGEQRPTYKGLICHPSVYSDTDINPYQFTILG